MRGVEVAQRLPRWGLMYGAELRLSRSLATASGVRGCACGRGLARSVRCGERVRCAGALWSVDGRGAARRAGAIVEPRLVTRCA